LFTQVPSALAAPLSGMIADRMDRKRTMIICDLLGAAAYAGMAVTGSPLGLITLRFLWRNRTLLTLTVVGAVTFLATEIVAVADLPLIRHFGVGGVGYGILNVAWGAGGLIGALIAARIVSKDNETAAAVLGVLVLGVFVAAVGISPWPGYSRKWSSFGS
jgi:MFS family permease